MSSESGCPIRIRHLDDVIENDVTDKLRKELERPLRYSDLEKSQYDLVNRLLNGGVNLDQLPCLRPKTVRMFVCSSGPGRHILIYFSFPFTFFFYVNRRFTCTVF